MVGGNPSRFSRLIFLISRTLSLSLSLSPSLSLLLNERSISSFSLRWSSFASLQSWNGVSSNLQPILVTCSTRTSQHTGSCYKREKHVLVARNKRSNEGKWLPKPDFFHVLTLKMVIFLKTSNAYNLERIPNFLASIALQIILRNRFTFCFKDGKTVKHNGAKNLEEMAPKQFCETPHPYSQKSFRKTLENVCNAQKK